MSEAVTSVGFQRDAFDAFVQSRNEPAWLRDQRAEAWRQFESLPWPSQRDEEWMRTDIRMFHLDKFGLPAETGASNEVAEGLLTHGVELGGHAASLDSRAQSAALRDKWASQGVLFGSLDELVAEHGDLVKQHLFRAVDPHQDKFAALHAATWSGGTLLYVPRGVVIVIRSILT